MATDRGDAPWSWPFWRRHCLLACPQHYRLQVCLVGHSAVHTDAIARPVADDRNHGHGHPNRAGPGSLCRGGAIVENPLIRIPVAAYIELFRSTPALVQLVWVFYALPIVLGINLASFTSIVIALTGNVRCLLRRSHSSRHPVGAAGSDRGGWRLASRLSTRCASLFCPRPFATCCRFSFRRASACFKETYPLVSSLGVADLMYTARLISTQNYRPLELLTVAAILYFIVAFPFTLLARWLELRLARNI